MSENNTVSSLRSPPSPAREGSARIRSTTGPETYWENTARSFAFSRPSVARPPIVAAISTALASRHGTAIAMIVPRENNSSANPM